MIPITEFSSNGIAHRIVDLHAYAGTRLLRLPYFHRVLLEDVLRNAADRNADAAREILLWLDHGTSEAEIPFRPVRIMMHDTTCVPALVDIAGLRAAVAEAGGDPTRLNPVLPVDVSVDHSIAVDRFCSPDAMAANVAREYERNGERYRFMKWATLALDGLRVHPPGTGIMHTLNLERLASVVTTEMRDGEAWAVPDTLIGTDSHTPMINGIGVVAWGVGGLEAESVLFGMPVTMRVPDIVGVRLVGAPRESCLATDLALAVTERLRRIDLSDRFVEFFGPGVASLSAGQRAVIANMTPEFGANSGYFPIDRRVLDYLAATGRPAEQVALVRDYAMRQGLWFDPDANPRYSDEIEFDLGSVETSVAGPRRPQDRWPAGSTAKAIAAIRPLARASSRDDRTTPPDGAVAIAAITSCTNTSDIGLLIAAGLLARKARRLGLKPPSWVKTSLAPGSPTAEHLLRRAGLLDDLAALGFDIVGYGCTTCIGNSGPLTAEIESTVRDRGVLPVAVLSGNRNFPGRVHPNIEAGFLASPPLVVAFALAGDVDRDIVADPLSHTKAGQPVRLADLWPTAAEIEAAATRAIDPADYPSTYAGAEASRKWADLNAPTGALFPWDEHSTYIRRPPFAGGGPGSRLGRFRAHPLIVLGDDITTDHISPAGQIPPDSAAGRHLVECGEDAADLNVFAARRGNWRAMLRGMFTNKTVRNLLADDIPPGSTVHAGSGEVLPLFQAAERYGAEQVSTVIVAGERYGMGSSRDWAAKGVGLLAVRAVLALSFERIHRSNLIGMGILPLKLPADACPHQLALRSEDELEINAAIDRLSPRCPVSVTIHRRRGDARTFNATAAIETKLEIQVLAAGGLLPLMLKRALAQSAGTD
jgi:aconitate hydratase